MTVLDEQNIATGMMWVRISKQSILVERSFAVGANDQFSLPCLAILQKDRCFAEVNALDDRTRLYRDSQLFRFLVQCLEISSPVYD